MFKTSYVSRKPTALAALFALWGILFSSGAFAQPVGERVGPQFPYFTSSARAAGIADASNALIDDFSGFSSNPGALGLMTKSVVDYTTQRVAQGVNFEHLGVSYKTTDVDAIAFGVDVLHYGGLDFYRNSDVRKLGYELRTGLAYGRLLADQFSVGINIQAITSTTGPNSVWSFAGDIGLSYAPGKHIRYALTLSGLGTDYNVASQITPTDYFSKTTSKVLALGLVLDYPIAGRTQKVLLAFQNEKVIGEAVLIYKLGIEYYPFWSPMFRAAVRLGALIRDPDAQPRIGLGVGYAQFSLDYAYGYIRRYIQPSHMFTLTYNW